MSVPLFLDANASVPVLGESLEALRDALGVPGNPSSPHALGRAARRQLDRARAQVASALGGLEKEVMFTSGASEANRWLVDALVERARLAERPLRVCMSPFEHPSLRKPLLAASRQGAISLVEAQVESGGAIRWSPDDLRAADAVFLTAAHNETGLLPLWDDVLPWVSDQALVASDAAQAVGRLPPLPERVDAVVASAHKMGGVAGVGAMLLRPRARALPLPWAGGGQEGGRRPGTEPLALISAMGAAAACIERTRASHAALQPLRDDLERRVLEGWPGAWVIGQGRPRLPQTSAICLRGADGDALRMAIDRAGVCVGFGSACSALAPEPSPALMAMGLSSAEARATVRLSLAPGASAALVDEATARFAALGGRRASA